MSLPYHAWTHRASWQGGTDPIDPQLPFVSGSLASPTTVSADVELELNAFTNDTAMFAWDPLDPAGLLIQRSGTYFAMANYTVPSGNQTAPRDINILLGKLSAGPFAGDNFGALQWWLGAGQGDHSLAVVTGTSGGKTILNIMGLQRLTVNDPTDDDDIYRVVIFIDHQGTNFSVTQASLTIIRIGTDDLVEPLPPNLVP